jgi:hypothetical protein
MKRLFLVLTIGFLCLNQSKAEKIEGYILTKENDTVRVTFKIPIKIIYEAPDYEKLQLKVKYFDASGKRKTLKPAMANEFVFERNGETVRMISRQVNSWLTGISYSVSGYMFLKLITDGRLKLFMFYQTNFVPTMIGGPGAMVAVASFPVENTSCRKTMEHSSVHVLYLSEKIWSNTFPTAPK